MATITVFVLSDSTGNLARHMMGVFMTQFPMGSIACRFEPFITTQARLQAALDAAKIADAAVCHALVSRQHKKYTSDFCQKAGLPCRDLTGGTVEFLAKLAGRQPNRDVDALHRMDDTYKRRIGAMEFTLAHDDGLGLETLKGADVVLAGVSRTSKTPTSFYLALQGYRAANVALAMEVAPPKELLAMPPEKVIGLLIDPQQLVMIRSHREAGWQNDTGSYAKSDHVMQELAWARRLYGNMGWRSLDVTDRAIEETAARVIGILGPPTGVSSDAFADLE